MSYFHRKPVAGLTDAVKAQTTIPGLPSRGPAPRVAAPAGALPIGPWASPASIVDRATAVLASEQQSAPVMRSAMPGAGMPAISQFREHAAAVIGELSSLADARRIVDSATSGLASVHAPRPRSDETGQTVEPAPVLSPPGPVSPGATAQTVISLTNEDTEPARIVFFGTGLIGDDGATIPADRISFKPPELILAPGTTDEVCVRVMVPAQTGCGVYSGLLRASQLDHLHAVLVVQVEKP